MQLPQAKSLKKTLIVYTSLLSVIMGCVLMFSAYRLALEESNEILDSQMRYLAERSVSDHPQIVTNHFQSDKTYHEEDLFVDVWAYAEHSDQTHPLQLLVEPKKEAGFYLKDTVLGKWHTYVLPLKDVQIQISQQHSVRQSLALELAISIFLPYVVLISLMILALSWLISKILQPLDDFKMELSHRKANDLQHLDSMKYPLELMPSIDEINRLFEKISEAQQEQRQFIADAAHELRTPITALNLQSKILLQEFPESHALHNLNLGLLRIQHLVTQLLSLAKQDAALLVQENTQKFYINVVAVSCIEQLLPVALQKEIDLGMVEQVELEMTSNESAVHSILYNLIENAIKYTPIGGVVNVSLCQRNNNMSLMVEDSGEGVAEDQFEHLTKRFYRVHHHKEVGSGLGLAIVNQATQKLSGRLYFSRSQTLGGLKVEVILPVDGSAIDLKVEDEK